VTGACTAGDACIAAVRRALTRRLRAAGLDSPDLDARLLVGHALGLDHAELVRDGERALAPADIAAIETLANRRLTGEPVARIIGSKEFWGLAFALTPAVLVPRPDTETVVETALARLGPDAPSRPLRIADLGTGSGAILIALLHELPAACGTGTDISVAALATAQANAGRNGVSGRAAFVACDFGAALAGGFDVVVSNPPYIATTEIAGLAPEVRAFDPRRALDGGPDGLAAYRSIVADAPRLLSAGGHLVMEVGAGQAPAVCALAAGMGLGCITVTPDLGGVARVVSSRRHP
jgi:release factor glutamine methyltransferase